jgi:hypothetical protein
MDLALVFQFFIRSLFCQAALADVDLKQVGTVPVRNGTRVLQLNETMSCIEFFLLSNSKLPLCANSEPDF